MPSPLSTALRSRSSLPAYRGAGPLTFHVVPVSAEPPPRLKSKRPDVVASDLDEPANAAGLLASIEALSLPPAPLHFRFIRA
jgi:hypothetical protein